MANSTLTYNGQEINQREDGYVNATQMCAANEKKVSHWLSNKETESYIQELASDAGIPASELVLITKGGDSSIQGTWIHPLLALNLGRWISPKFAIWCDRHIKTLMETGSTSIKPMSQSEIVAYLAARNVELERRLIEQQEAIAAQESRIDAIEAEQERYAYPGGRYYTCMGYGNLHGLKLTLRECAALGKKASSICRGTGLKVDRVNDPRFGQINAYPELVLSEVFADILPEVA